MKAVSFIKGTAFVNYLQRFVQAFLLGSAYSGEERTRRRWFVSAMQKLPKRRKEFASIEHLSPEAVAAYVDQELTPAAVRRAENHLIACPECRGEVERQCRAAAALQACSQVDSTLHAPSDLIAKLAGIEASCPQGPKACLPPDAPDRERIKALFHTHLSGIAGRMRKKSQKHSHPENR